MDHTQSACKLHRIYLYLVSVHQMALLLTEVVDIWLQPTTHLSTLSWPGWLTYSGRFTYLSGHPSAAGRAQDGESSPVKDRHSTTVPCNQPIFSKSSFAVSLVQCIALLTLKTWSFERCVTNREPAEVFEWQPELRLTDVTAGMSFWVQKIVRVSSKILAENTQNITLNQ